MIDQTCNAGTKFENVQLITKEMQYLYNDGGTYYFMDNETYEQVEAPADFIGDNAKWFKENDNAQLLYADTELLGVQPPMFIEAEITETDPGFKGDTVQGGSKPPTIETGAVIQVPMYLNQGERIKVDTRTGKFVSRVWASREIATPPAGDPAGFLSAAGGAATGILFGALHAAGRPARIRQGVQHGRKRAPRLWHRHLQGVVSTIVSIAPAASRGVASVGGNDITSSLISVFTSRTVAPENAVESFVEDDSLHVTVHLAVFYGYPFTKLAADVRDEVAAAITEQIGVGVAAVDVCIDSLVFPKE